VPATLPPPPAAPALPAPARDAPPARPWAELPAGRALPEAEFRRRHRWLLAVLWAHAPALAAFGLLQGAGPVHALLEGGVAVGAIAGLATLGARRRKAATALVALGLLTCSALLVHFSEGVIEAHFHFFVVVVALTLYEDWLAFGLAAAYVALHHGVLGTVDPQRVFNHPGALSDPWTWAVIHAGFIAAAGAAAVVAWRLNEDLRAEKDRALARAHAAEAAARRAAQELERSNRDLQGFAYVASHDLSEPLRTVASFLELLQRRYAGRLGPDADEFIAFAVGGAERMQELIDDLLELSRVGSSDLAEEPVALDAVVRRALRGLEAGILAAGAEVDVEPLPVVRGDARRLEQVLQNLLANAVKFVAPGAAAHVRVFAEAADEDGRPGWTIHVQDDGIGVDPLQVERVFKMFQRLHAREAYEGTGIGLAICARIVERHGGRIWVDPAPGGGSRFAFWLPAA
jgi:signal transduction histidine kinase